MRVADQTTACRREVLRDVRRLWKRGRLPQRRLARDLCVPASTLRRWCTAAVPQALPGRLRLPCSSEQIESVWARLRAVAGRTTVATLKAIFPAVARRVLEQALSAMRRMLRIARRRRLAQLTWSRPGTVWAADFTQLDGRGGPHARPCVTSEAAWGCMPVLRCMTRDAVRCTELGKEARRAIVPRSVPARPQGVSERNDLQPSIGALAPGLCPGPRGFRGMAPVSDVGCAVARYMKVASDGMAARGRWRHRRTVGPAIPRRVAPQQSPPPLHRAKSRVAS